MNDIKPPGRDWRSILTLLVSALAIVYFVMQSLVLGVFWLIFTLDATISTQQSITLGLLFWTSLLAGVLLVPLLLLSIYRLQGVAAPQWLQSQRQSFYKRLRWIIPLWPALVGLGWLIASNPNLAAFFLGPINLLVAGLPVLGILFVARRGLSGGSQMRQWGIFGFSITLLPLVVIIAELIAILFLGGGVIIWLSVRMLSDPQLEREINFLVNQVMIYGDNLEGLLQFFQPIILQPAVIFWALGIFGGILPIIEEVFKPLALWGFAGQKITQQEGFVGGMLCGAGFALMENVLYFTNAILAEDWLFMAVGRAGTGVLHMFASGLIGWGLAKAWQKGKWASLLWLTLSAFVLHGVWNMIALISGTAPLFVLGAEPAFWQMLLFYVPLILLLFAAMFGLVRINHHLRAQEPQVDQI